MRYDWVAARVFVGAQIGLSVGGRFLAFRIPALERMRVLNREADRTRLSRPRYAQAVKTNNRGALITSMPSTFIRWNLPYFPFKTLSHITAVHAGHHVDMNQGNYATLSTLYDRIFARTKRR